MMARSVFDTVPARPGSDEGWVSTSVYPYHRYPFSAFNPVQAEALKQVEKDSHLILAANTSTGKTVCAEFFMWPTLQSGKRVIYLSPYKALTEEKYTDWRESFGSEGYNLCVMTGDYELTPQKKQELERANIILMTSEMADSRSRKAELEGGTWLFETGLIVVDEAHIIGVPKRGATVEIGLARLTELIPEARVLLLSATLPGVENFERWLRVISPMRDVAVIQSNWRPVPLKWNVVPSFKGFNAHIDRTVEVLLNLVGEGKKTLAFVHSKVLGNKVEAALREKGIAVAFHNADKELEERREIERAFREGQLEVLVSTSTLAWGLNLPARAVVIAGVRRGYEEVHPVDVIQMGGRAGRYGLDPEGEVYLLVENEKSLPFWRGVVFKGKGVTLNSELLDPSVLRFHVLGEVFRKGITRKEDFSTWYGRTFAYAQGQAVPGELEGEVWETLEKESMVRSSPDGRVKVTGLGRQTAIYYFSPDDACHWALCLEKLAELEVSRVMRDDVTLALILGTAPSYGLPYVPQGIKKRHPRGFLSNLEKFIEETIQHTLFCRAYGWGEDYLAAVVSFYELLQGAPLLSAPSVGFGLSRDGKRLGSFLAAVATEVGAKDWAPYWELVGLRLYYRVPWRLVPWVVIDGIGSVRARTLAASFDHPEEVPNALGGWPANVPESLKGVIEQACDDRGIRAKWEMVRGILEG